MQGKADRKEGEKRKVQGFQVLQDECIWMKAGVVNFRLCDNAYDCFNCPFDRGMRRAMGEATADKRGESVAAWAEQLKREYQGPSRPCRHFLTGRIQAPKICPMNYECYHCPFDQMLDDMELSSIASKPPYMTVSGYRLADGYYYHLGHSWARIEHSGRIRAGFDDFLVKIFGAARTLELPPLGASIKQGQPAMAFRRNGNGAQVLSPVTGTVLASNRKVEEHPEITLEDPYVEGWLFIIEPKLLKANLRGLYYGKESFHWLENEAQALLKLIGPEYEALASTGGEPVSDLFGHFPDIGWEQLVQTFLHT
jgi:glycine cleavage system H lipoate-binding protein